jgi:hypothetical protein
MGSSPTRTPPTSWWRRGTSRQNTRPPSRGRHFAFSSSLPGGQPAPGRDLEGVQMSLVRRRLAPFQTFRWPWGGRTRESETIRKTSQPCERPTSQSQLGGSMRPHGADHLGPVVLKSPAGAEIEVSHGAYCPRLTYQSTFSWFSAQKWVEFALDSR